MYLLNQTVESIYNVLIAAIYNKGLVEGLMKEDETLVKKREDLTRVLGLLDKSLHNLTKVRLSTAGKSVSPSPGVGTKAINPWEKNAISPVSEIDWSVVKSTKSLLPKK